MSAPDLLYERGLFGREELPMERRLSEALTFGFARGVERERLMRLAEPDLGESTFDKSCFVDDLFLKELVHSCFSLKVRERRIEQSSAFFERVLCSPPLELGDIRYRQEILSELAADEERAEWLENAYLALIDFRDALCGSDHFNQRSVGVRRRIDILVALRKALDALYRATSTSQSGLLRLTLWVEQVRKTSAYENLVQLLDFEEGRSVLETRLQAGYDGSLRRFDIVRITEVEHRNFPRGPVARFFRSVISLLRGYRFSEEDVMSQVLDQVFTGLEKSAAVALGVTQQLEFYLRARGFQKLADSRGLATCRPEWVDTEQAVYYESLFNPWLLAKKGCKVVPCSFRLESNQRIGIVTGPNSGGKTRLLQSLAVAQLLGQCGLPVPAKRVALRPVNHLFLSLIEHVQADQAEGKLGQELIRIRHVFESASESSLILMDELCSGTNPSEGERIFEMVLDLLEELGPQVWITTHFLDFAARVEQRALATVSSSAQRRFAPSAGRAGLGVVAQQQLPADVPSTVSGNSGLHFLQVQLDDDELPTYQFVPGVAETSLARNTASRLGVTREELRRLVRGRSEN